MLLQALMVLSTVHLEGEVPAEGGDFIDVPFEVPAGTVEIEIAHDDGSDVVVLDWGARDPSGGFRGWGGGNDENAIIGVAESSRSYLAGPIAPGTWTVTVGKALVPPAGARYSIDVTCRDDATLAPRAKAPFTPVVLSTERRWYRGDFHVHSNESGDASASLDQIATLARSRGLDFVNLSDHNTDSQLALQAAHQAGLTDLLLLRGAEITTYAGHGNAVGLAGYVDHRIGLAGRTIANVLDDVAAQDALFIVNHPTLELGDSCIGCAWGHDPTPWQLVSGIEVITGKWEVVEPLLVPLVIEMWDQLADQGFRIAAIGGSDDHRAGTGTGPFETPLGSPTTLVLADNLSEAAIVDAIRRGRTIVQLRGPDDPLVELTLARPDGGVAEIGDEVTGVSRVALTVRITGGATTFVQLWRDGVQRAQIPVTGDAFTHTFEDVPGEADHRYRVELISDINKRLVVTSHIYVRGIAAGGCGCRTPGGGAGLAVLVPLIALLVGRRRR